MLYDRKTNRAQSLSESLDSSVDEFTFAPDSKSIYLTAEERGKAPIYSVSTSGGPVKKVIAEGVNGDLNVTADGRTLVFGNAAAWTQACAEIYRVDADGNGAGECFDHDQRGGVSAFQSQKCGRSNRVDRRSRGPKVARVLDNQTRKLQAQQEVAAGRLNSRRPAGSLE